MPRWLTREYWQSMVEPAMAWVDSHVLNLVNLGQLVAVAAGFLLAYLLAGRGEKWLRGIGTPGGWHRRLAEAASRLCFPVIWLFVIYVEMAVARALALDSYVLTIAASLLAAWVVISLFANVVRNPALYRIIVVSAWTVAALNIVGLLDPTIAFLDSMAFEVGEVRLSVLSVVTALLTFILLVWAAVALAGLLEHQLAASTSITPSAQVLFAKLAKIGLVAAALVIGMTASGIDLTAFAVFGGAIGLGLGFGLQKVVSNLISGVILLLDRSIKPGDVIEFGNTYGWINKLAARYTSVVTRNGTEYLIPNEDMITQPVINWSHSNRQVRRSIPVGVSYGSDIRKAMELMVEAAGETDRILESPAPRCLLKGFGDSSVDLELRMWIEDPQNGVSNVASEVLLKIWDKFREAGIEIPFPQRDLHIVSGEGLQRGWSKAAD